MAEGKDDTGDSKKLKEIAFIMFEGYEPLDAFGPAEIFGSLTDIYTQGFYSLDGGVVSCRQKVPLMTEKLESIGDRKPEIILIPGGFGTRQGVENEELIAHIKRLAEGAEYVMTVCTGTALLAKTGLLDGRKATTNKVAFSWVVSQGPKTEWNKAARWVVDDKYWTSSGVSAGMDMAFGFLADRFGAEFARKSATRIEYVWNENKDDDTFVAQV